MQVIGFFSGLFSSLTNLVAFVNTPIGELTGSKMLENSPFGQLSIMTMFGYGLVATLVIFLSIRLLQMINPF